MTRRSMQRWLTAVVVFALALGIAESAVGAGKSPRSVAEQARRILDDTGVKGGLIVHLGCGDGKLTAALLAGDAYLVHGLDASAANVDRARQHIRSLGRYGDVSVERFTGGRLPYADNLVNLVVSEDLGGVSMSEVTRVLCPGGVAVTLDSQLSTLNFFQKPRPKDIDEWTHYLHDASGNAVAADAQVGPPKHIRWVADPLWSRSHEFNPSINALVSGGGRMFYILDEGIAGLPDLRFPSRWALCARDAFNGTLLWKRPVPNWGYREWNTRGMWSAPLTLNRRVVTDGQRVFVTFGYKAPVTVLDAATGQTLRTIAQTDGTDEMILSDGVLLACVRQELSVASPPTPEQVKKRKRRMNPHEYTIGPPGPASIVAVDAESGSVLWKLDPQPVTVLTLAALGDRVSLHGSGEIVCLDMRTGRRHWATPCAAGRGSRHSGGTLVMHDDVVLFTSKDGLTAMSAADGRKLWTGPRVSGPGVTHPPDLFVAGGLVWGGDTPGMHSRERTAVRRDGYDLKTGEVRKTIEVPQLFSPLHHVRCYRSKATDRYLLLTKRGVEFFDLEGDDHMRHDWLRAMCHYGFLPSDGLLYVPSHHCFCFPGVKMKGFLALAANRSEGPAVSGQVDRAPRLQRGPAYGAVRGSPDPARTVDRRSPGATAQRPPVDPSAGSGDPRRALSSPQPPTPSSSDWPTYRHDPLRSGHTKAPLSAKLKPLWQTKLGGKITPPVVAGGKVYVAAADAQQVCCLDAQSGKEEWTFTAGSRVDSPPTIHTFVVPPSGGDRRANREKPPEGGTTNRLCLFGCCDGWVYCLRAADGELAWRFRAAPDDRRIVAFGRLESPWPVPGSVLMLDGVAYVCAGRSSFLDGGVFLYGLNPRSGELLHQTCVQGPWPDAQKDVGRPFDMEGTKSDVLVTDGNHIFLYQMAFDKQLNDVTADRASTLGDRKAGRHLIATGGFLEDVWFDRTFWTYSDRWPGFYYANNGPKAGQILVFDETTTYGLHVFTERLRLSPAFTPGGEGYELFADDNDNEPVLSPTSIDREKGPGFSRAAPPVWSKKIPLRALAMVLAGDKLFMAGPPDVVPDDDPYAAFEGRKGVQLWAVAADDGEKLAQYELDSLPVFDGMIAAGGRLFLSMKNGTILCMVPDR